MRTLQLCMIGALVLVVAVAAASASPASLRRAAAPASPAVVGARYRTVASLDDGPSELRRRAHSATAGDVHAPSHPQPLSDNWQRDFMDGQRLPARFSEQQRLEHAAAAKAAFEYANQYVGNNYPSGAQYRKPARRTAPAAAAAGAGTAAAEQAGAGGAAAGARASGSGPSKFSASTYELIARAKEVTRQARLRQQQQQEQKAPPPFAFADAGAFVEEGVRLRASHKSRDPYEKQEWTYSDTESPPEWLVPDGEAKQGCPTTKPPPVPRMPPPPPPQPTPTWMSPFDEHNTPVFPHSATPAPFYGMGPAPSSPPGNYLPLDTFLSPKEDEE